MRLGLLLCAPLLASLFSWLPLAAAPTSPTEFGDRLYSKRDFPGALAEYRRALYEARRTKTTVPQLHAKIALTLLRLRRYSHAMTVLRSGSSDDFALGYLRLFTALKLGYTSTALYEDSRLRAQALPPERKEQAALLGGLVLLEHHRYARARSYYSRIRRDTSSAEVRGISDTVLRRMDRYTELPRKSPLLAGFMAALLPGSGHFYSEHYADGASALLFNTMFLGAAGIMYGLETAADRPHDASVAFGVVGLIFYVANITGAAGAARRFNVYQERRFQQDVRRGLFNVPMAERVTGVRFTTPL